jgi:hypothetical protein
MDRLIGAIATEAHKASNGSVAIVVTATGASARGGRAMPYKKVVRSVERRVAGPAHVVEAAALGGLYLDQKVLAGAQIAQDDILGAMKSINVPSEGRLMADVFPAISVTFARYC